MCRLEQTAIWLTLALALPACAVESSGKGSGLDPSETAEDQDDPDPIVDAGRSRDAKVESSSDATYVKPDRVIIAVDPGPDTADCGAGLEIVVRDFTESHPDFEKFTAAQTGLVREQLGPDKRPVYASSGATPATSGPDGFKQWYSDVDGVNQRLSTQIVFTEQSPGVFVYESANFFPIDGMGFGNGPSGITVPILGTIGGGTAAHNFLFTTEAHTKFTYRGGEKFTFRGDDDMWVFLNEKLAIDLGGTHSALSASVDLDAEAVRLGLSKGESYPMDIFHAERHTNQSNYRIETTIDLSCIENVPVPLI